MPYFQGFHTFLTTIAISMNPITFVMNFHCNLFWHSGQSLLELNSDLPLLNFRKRQLGCPLGDTCYIHLTKRTSTHHIVYYFYILVNFYKQTFPCIHIFPLNLLPISGSPIRSFSLMQTLKIRSLHSTLRQYICSPDTLFSSFV